MLSLNKGEKLIKGQELISENRKFTAKIGQDGYFNVYYFNYFLWRYPSVIDRIEMQLDGNLVIYDAQNNTIETPKTDGKGDYFVLDNNGTITVYNVHNKYLWSIGYLFSKKI